jgi:hypothetical protein
LKKWSPYWDDLSPTTFWLLLWRSRSQHELQQNRVRPITLLFEVGFYNYLTQKGHSMTLQQKRVRPIT